MTHRFTTKYGRNLEIDLSKWKIDKNSRNCEIIEISEDYLLLENKYKDRFSIPEHIIKANNYNIVDNTIDLSEGLYENYFLNKFKIPKLCEMTKKRFEILDLLYIKTI